ncbi:hypothetical protein BFP97_10945 [Roseivirga sp. 4D4]|uniref:thioredoxin family protein n=1 Tax=Roseivirga sp. 4D4 TaxID=1889784 RepID=UPI000852BA01|nr:thioredoxin family protein [Roseivirga sp. 4D4]OEK02004.1 hypothetical protein BFP97_10945 [Roseivirga sp. 4D4]
MIKRLKLLVWLLLVFTCISSFRPASDSTFRLLIFEGSDWCANCRRLERNILTQEVFKEFLTQHEIVLEKVDFPQRKKLEKNVRVYNDSIATKYNFDGAFPTMLLINEGSKDYVKLTNYVKQSPEEMMTLLLSQMEALR